VLELNDLEVEECEKYLVRVSPVRCCNETEDTGIWVLEDHYLEISTPRSTMQSSCFEGVYDPNVSHEKPLIGSSHPPLSLKAVDEMCDGSIALTCFEDTGWLHHHHPA